MRRSNVTAAYLTALILNVHNTMNGSNLLDAYFPPWRLGLAKLTSRLVVYLYDFKLCHELDNKTGSIIK